ncbi:MAG: DUF3052 domain-containing protein [Bacteroidota bacterium]|nr:DUF3052 domain-containing protein [Bacteroidota bacterium]
MTTPLAGYSGTPLYKKLGIKAGFIIQLVNAPGNYLDLLTELPANIKFNDSGDAKDLIHFFTKYENDLITELPILKNRIRSNGTIWVSWPKRASKVITDITDDTIRNYALKIGLVDIKVCAVDEIWSGLKLVIPVKERVSNS